MGSWTEIKDLVSIISTVAVVIAGISGLETWKRQLKGNTEYESARKLLRSTYKVREAIKYVRNSILLDSYEISEAIPKTRPDLDLNEDLNRKEKLGAVFTYRWREVQEALIELQTDSFEAEALWGTSVKHAYADFYNCINELRFAIETMLDTELPIKEQREASRVVYGTDDLFSLPQRHEYANNFVRAINRIENFLRPKIELR